MGRLEITKFQAPAFAEAASRRQANNQISSPACRQAGMTNIQIQMFGDWDLAIGYYLGFACLPVGREFGYWELI